MTEEDETLIDIGPKSRQCLNEIGIFTKTELEKTGAVTAFVRMKKECRAMKPSLNLLYAMVAIIEDVHWKEIAKHKKGQLLLELENHRELDGLFRDRSQEIIE